MAYAGQRSVLLFIGFSRTSRLTSDHHCLMHDRMGFLALEWHHKGQTYWIGFLQSSPIDVSPRDHIGVHHNVRNCANSIKTQVDCWIYIGFDCTHNLEVKSRTGREDTDDVIEKKVVRKTGLLSNLRHNFTEEGGISWPFVLQQHQQMAKGKVTGREWSERLLLQQSKILDPWPFKKHCQIHGYLIIPRSAIAQDGNILAGNSVNTKSHDRDKRKHPEIKHVNFSNKQWPSKVFVFRSFTQLRWRKT